MFFFFNLKEAMRCHSVCACTVYTSIFRIQLKSTQAHMIFSSRVYYGCLNVYLKGKIRVVSVRPYYLCDHLEVSGTRML